MSELDFVQINRAICEVNSAIEQVCKNNLNYEEYKKLNENQRDLLDWLHDACYRFTYAFEELDCDPPGPEWGEFEYKGRLENEMRRTANIEYDEDGQQYLVFDDETMEELGWNIGDDLEWTDNENGSWTIRKIENEDG